MRDPLFRRTLLSGPFLRYPFCGELGCGSIVARLIVLDSIVAEFIVEGSIVAESIFSGFYVPASIVWESHVAKSIVALSNPAWLTITMFIVARSIVAGSI